MPDTVNFDAEAFAIRLKSLISNEKLNAFAERAGISIGVLHKYLSAPEGLNPSVEVVARIVNATRTSMDWLILGRGESPTHSNGQESAHQHSAPLLDTRLAAGAGVTAAENQIGNITIPAEVMQQLRRADTKGLYFMRSWGDSMHPTISDDALVLIDTLQTNLREGIIAFRYGNDLRVKRLRPVGLGDIEVISDNSIYGPERIAGAEKEHFDILGRAIWAGSIL